MVFLCLLADRSVYKLSGVEILSVGALVLRIPILR